MPVQQALRAVGGIALIGALVAYSAGAVERPAVDLPGAEIAILLSPPAPAAGTVEGKLVLTRMVGPESGGESIELPATAPGRVAVELPVGSGWRAEAVFPGRWGPLLELAVVEPAVLRLDLWPLARLQGRLVLSPGEPPGGPLALSFRGAARGLDPSGGVPDTPPQGREVVEVAADGSFAADLPAAAVDLRLHRRGYASEHFWNVPLAPGGPHDLGRIRLQPGSSVIGWVRLPPAAANRRLGDVELALRPLGADPRAPAAAAKLSALARTARPNELGFFRFVDLPPGSYELEASLAGLAPAEVPLVEVLAGREAELAQPLELHELSRLAVFLDPPMAPGERPWKVLLDAPDRRTPGLRQGRDPEPVGLDGRVTFEGLVPGERWLEVHGPDGFVFHRELVEVEPGASTHEVELEIVPVEGVVTQGDRPVAAKLLFGGRRTDRQVALRTDDDGRFEGFLPRAGRWLLLARTDTGRGSDQELEVEVAPSARGEVAWLDVRIPATWVRGVVIDPRGEPLEEVMVTASPATAKRLLVATGRADRRGGFELSGLSPGSYRVSALHGRRSSPAVVVELEEGSSVEDLVLVLEAESHLTLRVASEAGPVAGARVELFPHFEALRGLAVIEQGITGPDGLVALAYPAGAVRGGLSVLAPGFATRSLWLDLAAGPAGETVDVAVDRVGGTLTLGLHPCGEQQGWFILRHGGVTVPSGSLVAWASLHGQRGLPCGTLVLPMLGPGPYELCWGATGECVAGELPPFGELALAFQGPAVPERPSAER